MNILHDVSKGSPEAMNVIIEIQKGSKNKYEIDKDTGLIALDRAMHTSQDYPTDYGFIPQTLCDDGDALDVLLITTNPLFPGILVSSRPVGIIHMIDDGEKDDKVIAVPISDPRFNEVRDIEDVNKHTILEIKHFLSTYKQLQGKNVDIQGVGNAEDAKKAFDKASKMYLEDKDS